jgi:DNA polymerase-3 subunit alpha
VGRGSSGGCLIAYLINITHIDSVKYGCLFSRFFNIGRLQTGNLADIDVDIDPRYINDVIGYIKRKYGSDKVAAISTVVKLFGKSAIKDVARALAIGEGGTGKAENKKEIFSLSNRITSFFPDDPKATVASSVNESKELQKYKDRFPELFEKATKLEGLVRSNSIHACGMTIASVPLIEYLPMKLCKVRGEDDSTLKEEDSTLKEDDSIAADEVDQGQQAQLREVVDVDMKVLESRKFLKFDFLKLKTLSVIRDTLDMIKRNHNKTIILQDLSLDDEEVYKYMWNAPNLLGIFQFESAGMRDLIRAVKPRNIEELAHCNALYRPGPMDSGILDQYIKRRQGREMVTYDHIDLKPILESTYGLPIFQEQNMKIAQVIAGFSEQEADILRAAMGKKDKDKMASLKSKFLDGAVANGYGRELAEYLFDAIEKSSRYAFNKPHSVAYSITAYYTLWLKFHYPTEFITASINNEKDWDKISLFVFDAQEHNIKVLPVDVSRSQVEYTVAGDHQILTGFKSIKGVGSVAPLTIVNGAPYSSFIDFLVRTHNRGSKVTSAVVTAINSVGGFESLGFNRATTEAYYDKVSSLLRLEYPSKEDKLTELVTKYVEDKENVDISKIVTELMSSGRTSVYEFDKRQLKYITKVLSTSYPDKMATISAIPIQVLPDWPMLKKCKLEKAYLGYFVSGHPTKDFGAVRPKHYLGYINGMGNNTKVEVLVFVERLVVDKIVSGGKRMCKFEVSDVSGSMELTVFLKSYEVCPIIVGAISHILCAVNIFNGRTSLQFIKLI